MQLRSTKEDVKTETVNVDIMQNNINKKRKNQEEHEKNKQIILKKLKLEELPKKRELKPKPTEENLKNKQNYVIQPPSIITHFNMNSVIKVAKERFHLYLNTINFYESTYLLDVQGEIYEFLYYSYINHDMDRAFDKMLSIECKLNHITGFLGNVTQNFHENLTENSAKDLAKKATDLAKEPVTDPTTDLVTNVATNVVSDFAKDLTTDFAKDLATNLAIDFAIDFAEFD